MEIRPSVLDGAQAVLRVLKLLPPSSLLDSDDPHDSHVCLG